MPVYGLVNDTHGRSHYAMRFIKGQSLAHAIRELHADEHMPRLAYLSALRPLLTRFVAVCNTIAYAHSKGVIHRDLRPDNVMLGAFGETLAVDWRVAKVDGAPRDESVETPLLSDDTLATRDGQAVGTPAYMPPEQAAGDWEHVGPHSDIYSLGATLHAILTGKPTPRQADHRAPRALAAVVHRAMSKETSGRYASA